MANDIGKPVPIRKKYNIAGMKNLYDTDIVGGDEPQLSGTNAGGTSNWYVPGTNTGTETAGDNSRRPGALSRLFSRQNLSNVVAGGAKVANDLSPYASNIINAFRSAPKPTKGKSYEYTPLQKVNLSDERNKVSTMYQAANRNTERQVDENTGEAIKAFNRGDEISKLSAINERENNANVGISNQQAQMDAGVSAANTGLENKFRDEMVERQVANQREQSANVANAGDKAMMIRNERSKERTELGKARVLRGVYAKSGVLSRDNAMGRQWKNQGIPDPFGEDYKWLDPEKKVNGGALSASTYYNGETQTMGVPIRKKLPKRKLVY